MIEDVVRHHQQLLELETRMRLNHRRACHGVDGFQTMLHSTAYEWSKLRITCEPCVVTNLCHIVVDHFRKISQTIFLYRSLFEPPKKGLCCIILSSYHFDICNESSIWRGVRDTIDVVHNDEEK